jgi:hypothetical protein
MTLENLVLEVKKRTNKFHRDRSAKNSSFVFQFENYDGSYSILFTVFEDRYSPYQRINDIELLAIIKNSINSAMFSDSHYDEKNDIVYVLYDMFLVRMIIRIWKNEDFVQFDQETKEKNEFLIKGYWRNKLYEIIKRSYEVGLTLSEVIAKSRWITEPEVRYEILNDLCNQGIIEKYQKKSPSKKKAMVYRRKK